MISQSVSETVMTGRGEDNNNNSLASWQTVFTDWKDGNSGKLHLDVSQGVTTLVLNE